MSPVPVGLIGAHGHGLTHRRIIERLTQSGRVKLVAVTNRRPVSSEDGAPLDGVAVFTDHRDMLASAAPRVVVVATPPHTHPGIATDVAEAGAHLLLEKPPVATLAQFSALSGTVERAGVVCQVGFQALASPALPEVAGIARSGVLGDVSHLSVSGSWWRPDSYYRRTDWAGRPGADGALTNQFSHGIMQALALAGALGGSAEVASMELERYRTRPAEVEDTACLRLTLRAGPPIVVAVTVAAREWLHGDLTVHGSRGSVTLEYPTDRVRLTGSHHTRAPAARPERQTLLANLLDHLRTPVVPLAAPLAATGELVAVLEAISGAAAPARIPARYLSRAPDDDGLVLDGARDLVSLTARRGTSFFGSGVPWSHPPHRLVPGPVAHDTTLEQAPRPPRGALT